MFKNKQVYLYIVLVALIISTIGVSIAQKPLVSAKGFEKASEIKKPIKVAQVRQKNADKENILQSYNKNGGGNWNGGNFLSTGHRRYDIFYISFTDRLLTENACTMQGGITTVGSATDVQSGKINICTIPVVDTPTDKINYKTIISANGKIILPEDSSYLFTELGYKNKTIASITLNFNNCVIDKNTNNMQYMFNSFAQGSSVVNIALSGWPENFGNYVINMDSMFYAFASGASSLISLKIPDFPVGFGSQTTNMSYMFQDLAYQAYKLTLFQYPNFPVGFGSQAKTLRQMFDRSLLSTGVRNITIVFPAGFGQNTTTMYNMFTWVGGSGMTIDWSRTETFQSNANASGMFGNFSYGDGGLTLIFNTSKSAQTFAGKINSYDASKTTKIERSIVYFNTNGKFNVPEQEVSPSDKVIKPTNPKGYTFVNWYTNTDLTGTPFNFNTPINYNLTLYAVYTKNIEPAPQPVSVLTPTFATIKLLKIHAPITRFSVKKNKKVKFKYMLIYSNGMIKQNIKNIKYKKIGRKKVTIKAGNKRLKLVIRVVKRVVKSDGIKIIKVKSNSLIYIKIKSKDAAYYKFPKFSGKSKLNKYGIYTNKHQTIKIKWWGKSFKKKV